MNLTQLTSADLKRVAKLIEQKEALQAQIAKLDTVLTAYEGGAPAAPAKAKAGQKAVLPPKAKFRQAKRAKRGAVKAAMIALVKQSGKSGITVKEIAGKLNLGYNRVFTWFYNTGKKIKEIKKVGEARYGWAG